jgi:glycosyltransferase involved in cell wall biosynthesis
MTPVRVLQVVGQMNRGGAETWLMQILRNSDPGRLRMDFLVTRLEPGHYDEEIRTHGSSVLPCPSPSDPFAFGRRFLAILRERGPYDVVHSHLHHFSGIILACAKHASVQVRIGHSHNDTSALDGRAGPARRLYLRAMKAAIRLHATHGLAASDGAATALFGPRWREDPRWKVAHCGLDFSEFREPFNAAEVRAEIGVPPGALVVGHVGRFDPQKNHAFLLRIAAEVLLRDVRARLVLVGDGPLRTLIESESVRLRIRDRVVFTGVRADVPRLLRSFDVFLFPSVHEGLPIVGLEAQAAALRIVLSDTITRELEVIPSLFVRRSLAEPPKAWAASILSILHSGSHLKIDGVAALESSDFTLHKTLRNLERAYGLS